MSGTNATPEPQRNKAKQLATEPVPPGLPRERNSGHFSDEHVDRSVTSMQAMIERGETIATPGSRAADSEDRDIHEEVWRAHDRHGPYGQRRRRRN
ncbi:hypothetical protein ABZ370_37700 [Streptomyces sp. NPDC005962]|uniref:hypothetical protein n=1 Tax=Streptomyces sp. NPDC005962 TaxID=3154466 RepID=UPI0033E20301